MSGKSRRARVLGRALRMPSVLDRKGTRWMLQALSPAPVIVLVHRGRKTGRVYKTPIEIMVDDPERGEFVVGRMWGRHSDWYRNVVAGGLVEVHVRGETMQVEWRELDEAERRAAMDAYREAQPIYSRIILRMLVRLNPLAGDPEQAVVQQLPMLGLAPCRSLTSTVPVVVTHLWPRSAAGRRADRSASWRPLRPIGRRPPLPRAGPGRVDR